MLKQWGQTTKKDLSFNLPVYQSSSLAERIKQEERPTSVLIWLDSRKKKKKCCEVGQISTNTFQCGMLRAFQHARCSRQMKVRCPGCICCMQKLTDSMITITKDSIFPKIRVSGMITWFLQSNCKRSLISVSPKMFSRKNRCLVFNMCSYLW